MKETSFDISKSLRIFARCNEDGDTRHLTFTDSEGEAFDISNEDFELVVKKRSNSSEVLFTLSIGDGLSLTDTNILNIDISEENATQEPNTYFYQLISRDSNKTWLNGPFVFHEGEFDGVNDTDEVVVGNSNDITISVTVGGSSGGGTWGSITGTLSDQTDLQAALDDKWSLATGGALTGNNSVTSTGSTINFSSTGTGTSWFQISRTNSSIFGSISVLLISGTNAGSTTTSSGYAGIRVSNIFTPTNATAIYSQIRLNSTYNDGGLALSNEQISFKNNPTVTLTTGSIAKFIGYDYDPTITGALTSHIAFRAVLGNVLLGGSSMTSESAILDIQSTTKAMIVSRMTTAQKNAIGTITDGMILYDSTMTQFQFRENAAWSTFVTPAGAAAFTNKTGNISQWTNDSGYLTSSTGVTSVSGTTNRITSSGGTTPTIDISASYAGQSSITTLGTIGTGTWSGSVIGAAYGGTGIANNAASTITISGNFATTFTVSNTTGVTLPTSGTLATLAGAESLTNKKLGSLTSNGFVKTSGGDGTLSVDTSTYLTSLSGAYLLASGGTLTGANTIVGTTTNTLTYSFASLGTTQTTGAGYYLVNPTAAAAGAQQISPSRAIEGKGWKTDATAASQSVLVGDYVLPVQAAANPTLKYIMFSSVNGAANAPFFTFDTGAQSMLFQSTGSMLFQFAGVGASATKIQIGRIVTGAFTNNWEIFNDVSGGTLKFTNVNATTYLNINPNVTLNVQDKITFPATITAGGTTGNQTINKPIGTVNIAASGTTVTVTNSYCTTSSVVYCEIRTNDATALIKNVVPGSGSFVITLNVATTAEISIGFIVFN